MTALWSALWNIPFWALLTTVLVLLVWEMVR